MPHNSGYRVAVVGCGSIGSRHLEVLRGLEDLCPIAVPKRPERISELESAGYITARDLDEAVRKGAELCIIATDTGRHVDDGLGAIERGLDILVEKPIAPTAEEAHRLTERASQAGRAVFVGCVLRFSESLNTFRDLLPKVGQLHSVRIECQSFLPEWRPNRPYQQSYSADPREGGVLLDLIHEIDYGGWLFGWPRAVQGRLMNRGRLGIASDEVAELSWETPEGCVLSMNLDYLTRPAHRRIRACGDKGTIQWDAIAGTVTLIGAGSPIEEIGSSQTRNEMISAQTRAFVGTCRGEPDARLATGEDGVRALAVCDAARRSSRSRREECVEFWG
jgi:predicted dehydrogenase